MSQHDYVIANGTGSAVRADINGALTAIASANSGANSPSTTYAFQLWADTTSGNLKIRNGGNSAWIVVGALASANLGLILASKFPNVSANVTASSAELNKLDGVTATTAEINLLAGASALGVIMTQIYPVGHVYTSVVSTNPASLLAGMSGTTWVAFGAGRTIVGLDSSNALFNQPEETGGAETSTVSTGSHTLTIAQIPSHAHTYTANLNSGAQNGPISLDDSYPLQTRNTSAVGGGQGHSHTTNISILQPYIVVYFWKRTA